MQKHEDELWDEIRPVRKVRITLSRQQGRTHKQRHYAFINDDDGVPMGVLDIETDEWLYRLFKPSPSWIRFT